MSFKSSSISTMVLLIFSASAMAWQSVEADPVGPIRLERKTPKRLNNPLGIWSFHFVATNKLVAIRNDVKEIKKMIRHSDRNLSELRKHG